MQQSSTWKGLLVIAGLHDCAIGAYHLILPRQWNWDAGLQSVPASLVWGVYMINFSWSLLILTVAALIFYAAAQDPTASAFARRVVFAVGLFWALHGVYLWFHPVPVPDSLAWLGYGLAAFPAIAIILHWLPLWLTRVSFKAGSRQSKTTMVGAKLLVLLSAAVLLTAWDGATTEAGPSRASSQSSRNCPSEPPLEPGPQARDRAIAAVRESLRTGPEEWRTHEIQSAYPASRADGFGAIAVRMCGPVVGRRTWVVEMRFPKLEPSASLSQGQAFVSRFRSGWRVWYRYH